MSRSSPHAPGGRAFPAVIALTATTGILIQFAVNLSTQHDLGNTLWVLARFFTIWTNLLVAIVFGALALGYKRFANPETIGGVTIAILLVGIVYALLLSSLHHRGGWALVANLLMHKVTPVLVPLYWLVAVPRGKLKPQDPWWWTLYPLVYLAYALVRGSADGKFPYPFLDYPAHGWPHVLGHVAAIAGGFVLAGQLLLLIDRMLARKT